MKKIIAAILTASLLITAPVSAETIYEENETTTVTRGVTLQKVNTFSENGWVKANILKIDMTDDSLDLKVLTSPTGTSSLSTVKKMAEHYDTKAAVNADFFNMVSGETNMLGMVYQNGELVSTPSKDNFVSFAITEDNRVLFDYFTFSGTLYANNTSLTKASSCELYQINKVPVDTGAVTMITSAWGESVTVPPHCYAMICEPYDTNMYKMVGSSWGYEAVAIPENGAVFIANHSVNGFLNHNFALGDVIEVETTISPDTEKIKEASGGNTMLVENGEVCEFTSNITGKAQRTAMGLSPSGDTLYLVTIDGRQDDCAGFTQTDMASFMIELGCDTAINLDGGGSTTMVTEDRYTGKQTIQNTLSSQRAVSTALGIFSTAQPDIVVSGEIKTSSKEIILGDKVEVYAAFYDEYYNTASLVPEDITYTTTDEWAVVDANTITFSSPGTHLIHAEYDGVILETEVEVVDDIFAINIYPERVNATASSKAFTVTGYTLSGKAVNIPYPLVSFEAYGDITMTDNSVDKGDGKGTVIAVYNSLTSNAIVNGEKYEIPVSDIKASDTFEGIIEQGEKITVSGRFEAPNNFLGRFQIRERLTDLSTRGDVYALGDVYDTWNLFTVYRKVDGFTERVIENTKIVTLANSVSSSVRLTDSTAWGKIKTVCENISTKNIVFMLNNPVYNMNQGEQTVWNYYMNLLTQKGVNVFVVAPGEKSEATADNGVRYLYVGSIGNCSLASYEYGFSASAPLTLTFSGDEVKYIYQ